MTLDVRRVPSGQCRSPCEFHMAAPDEATEPVNLGNPAEISIRGLAERVIALTGSRSEIIHHALLADDPAQRQPDITMPELAVVLEATRGVKVDPLNLSKLLCAAGFSNKKTLLASEHDCAPRRLSANGKRKLLSQGCAATVSLRRG